MGPFGLEIGMTKIEFFYSGCVKDKLFVRKELRLKVKNFKK